MRRRETAALPHQFHLPSRPERIANIVGQRFGRLIVLRFCGIGPDHHSYWVCHCDCGNDKNILGYSLTAGHTRSCGCLQEESRTKHGELVHGKTSAEYTAYAQAKYRCSNPNNRVWKHYGGRGIRFRFTSFAQFMADVGPRPSAAHSLDRINNDGDYAPGNIRWATKAQQVQNSRHAKLTRQQVEEIRSSSKHRGSGRLTAKRFGVSVDTVTDVRKYTTWK